MSLTWRLTLQWWNMANSEVTDMMDIGQEEEHTDHMEFEYDYEGEPGENPTKRMLRSMM